MRKTSLCCTATKIKKMPPLCWTESTEPRRNQIFSWGRCASKDLDVPLWTDLKPKFNSLPSFTLNWVYIYFTLTIFLVYTKCQWSQGVIQSVAISVLRVTKHRFKMVLDVVNITRILTFMIRTIFSKMQSGLDGKVRYLNISFVRLVSMNIFLTFVSLYVIEMVKTNHKCEKWAISWC